MKERLINIVEDLKKDLQSIINEDGEFKRKNSADFEREIMISKLIGNYKTMAKLLKTQNVYPYVVNNAKFVLNELNNIKTITNDISTVAPFLMKNCFFNGEVLFYKDELNQYSDKEIKDIILNTIFYILNGFFKYTKKSEEIVKSLQLLLFGAIGYTNIRIPFSQSKRHKLYNNFKDNIYNLVLTSTFENTMLYFYNLAKNDKCRFIKVFNIDSEEYMLFRYVFPLETGFRFQCEYSNVIINNNKIRLSTKMEFDLDTIEYFKNIKHTNNIPVKQIRSNKILNKNYNELVNDLNLEHNYKL